jgi:hypothetical protein
MNEYYDFGYSDYDAVASGVPEITQLPTQPGTSIVDLIGKALSVYQLDRQQKAFLETNKQLALQGKPLLSWDQFAPTASVGVTIDSNTQKLLWTLGIGALAIMALSVLSRR